MTSRYEASPTSLRSLRDRLTAASKRENVVFGRLQQHVGILVVSQFMAPLVDERDEPLLLVKGGSSLELRRGIAESRTSKDLDVVMRADIETIHDRLVDAGDEGWQGFTSRFTQPSELEVPGLNGKIQRFTAKLSFKNKPFISLPIEASPIEAGNADDFDPLSTDGLSLGPIPIGPSPLVPRAPA